MKHLNGNLICVVDTETTGLEAGKHDLIQICILPLDNDLKPNKMFLPFYMNMLPKRPHEISSEALKINKLKLCEIIEKGLDPWKCVDLFGEWFDKLGLAEGKRIMPLAQNWPFDKGFVIEWLGPLTYDLYFHHYYRDTFPVSLYLNDRADFFSEPCPFPKHSLSYLCNLLGVQREPKKAHDALQDCLMTAEVYRRMLSTKI